jgi:GTPase SAR1 family protein
MKLIEILLEAKYKPKAIVMAGGAGAGKTYLLNQLSLDSLEQFNPDKYVEDPDHPYYNNLGAASQQVNRDVEAAADDKTSFFWDTTASGVKFDQNLDKLLKNGYDVYMVMVYTHPMISYISNFERERNVPASSTFSTWRNAYQKIEDFNRKLKGNLSIFVNLRGGKYDKEIEAFNTAAKNGPRGIKEYLQRYNEKTGAGKSSFFKPVEMSKQEEEEFQKAVADVDYDKSNRSEDKAIKTAFLKTYRKIGTGPGDDKLRDAVKKYREEKEKADRDNDAVLESIAEMLFSPTFQELLKHSSPQEIDQKVQEFLA